MHPLYNDIIISNICILYKVTVCVLLAGITVGFRTLKVLDNRGNALEKVALKAYNMVYPHTYLMTTR